MHGGYGYTRDFPVEQYWRDNRLNLIHEGTHGIQALDLLGRKVLMHDGAAFKLLAARLHATLRAAAEHDTLRAPSRQLQAALQALESATRAAWADATPEQALANATPYLQACGHVVLAWIWLDVALASEDPGRRAARRYFYAYELPKIDAWLGVVSRREDVCRNMQEDWF